MLAAGARIHIAGDILKNHDELDAAVQRAYASGENIVVTAHGIGFVAFKSNDQVIVSQMDDLSNHFVLSEKTFKNHGLDQASPASMSLQFFREEEHARL